MAFRAAIDVANSCCITLEPSAMFPSLRACLLVVLACLGACVTTSQPEATTGGRDARRHFLKSAHTTRTYQIDVLPVLSPVRPPPGGKLPVVFVLDGNLLFPAVSSMASLLSLGEMPSVLVVGIGYQIDAALAPGPFLLQYQALRNRDYTPTLDRAFLAQMQASYARLGATYPAAGAPGGAEAFLAFIEEELKPFIAAHYPAAGLNDATLMGESLGGLFAMHVLLESPQSFSRYVASSPSLWWDGLLLTRRPLEFGQSRPRLFVSLGSLESQVEMVAPLAQMDARLKSVAADGLEYHFQVFEGETHISAVFAGFSRGLREVFR
jgi:predicted alpha/beta superfamily hydrolase